ncbi:MFS general substrate transporter [Trametes sanguinea]|nr:MFS general substrate transporter [Trametes sanguinea]
MQAVENHPQQSAHSNGLSALKFSAQKTGDHDIEKIDNSPPYCPVTHPDPAPVRRGKIRLASAFFAYFVIGWGDGVTGTLLPHFKSDLHLSFLLSSLFWVASASGYALGTISVEYVTRFLGRTHLRANQLPTAMPISTRLTARRTPPSTIDEPYIVAYSQSRSRFYTMLSASILHAVFFVVMGSKSGYPSMMVAYVISAFARSFISGTPNPFVSNVYVPSISKKGLGFLYGSTSVGGFAAPLVCQSIIATGIRWADFYFGSLVLSALNTLLIIYAFWPTQEELRSDADLAWNLRRSTPGSSNAAEVVSQPLSPTGSTAPILRKEAVLGPRTYKTALKQLQTWTSALFALVYTGSESATQGFIVVYLLAVRNANPNTVGYVTSGFWGGMALSRFIWGYLGGIITFRQRKWIVQACIFIAFAMNLLILLVPSSIENAVSTAVIGAVFGPVFPANLASARDLLPAELHMVSLAIIAACASCGAALFPFITGLLSSTVGARTFPYVTIAQTVAMFCIWILSPSRLPDTQN